MLSASVKANSIAVTIVLFLLYRQKARKVRKELLAKKCQLEVDDGDVVGWLVRKGFRGIQLDFVGFEGSGLDLDCTWKKTFREHCVCIWDLLWAQ